MIELPLVLIAGLLGSSHCLGMCGPFALAIGAGAGGWRSNLRRQLTYSAGRLFTYSVLGTLAGYGGMRLAHRSAPIVNGPAMLAILAGGLLLYQGLATAGVLTRRRAKREGPCLGGTFFAAFLRSPQPGSTFLAGVITGLLPCGLVYAFLALAASSGDAWLGAATMFAFGLGTVPLMVLTGCGSLLLSITARQHVLRVAAWCVVVAGLISIGRGISFARSPSGPTHAACPFCGDDSPIHQIER